MTWKWRLEILKVVDPIKLKSTSRIQREASKLSGKSLGWSPVFKTLRKLCKRNLIEMFETDTEFLFRLK